MIRPRSRILANTMKFSGIEQGGEGYGGAPGSGVDRCSENGSSVALASGEEVDRAMRDQQNQQGEQNAAGIETPG